MKRIVLSAIAVLGMATIANADPIEGTWQTQPDDGRVGHIKISSCSGGYCGTLVRSYDTAGNVVKTGNEGSQIVRQMAPTGGGNYTGKVFRPSNGKIYNGKAAVSGNAMKLSGCVAGGLLCSSQTWQRVN